MQLIHSTEDLQAYLEENRIINYYHPVIQKQVEKFIHLGKTKQERAKLAFNFVRDEIRHSFDINSEKITITASEALECKEGICFAKAHLLASFLRAMDIPCGFCYQRVTRKGTPESGYALHGLNAVYFEELDTWIRLDPRGNKEGVYSEFSIDAEKLAYPIRKELEEKDYPFVYSDPLDIVIAAMESSSNCKELFFKRPTSIF